MFQLVFLKLIKKFIEKQIPIDNLYLDCNSIIYDVYNQLDVSNLSEKLVITIIKQVIKKIEDYILTINPQKTVIIAFDGVAPVAKLNQQRERRYKFFCNFSIQKPQCGLGRLEAHCI